MQYRTNELLDDTAHNIQAIEASLDKYNSRSLYRVYGVGNAQLNSLIVV